MATAVHVHFYRGISQLPKVTNRQFSSDSVLALHEPRIPGGGVLSATSTAVESSAAPSGTKVCRIQVEDSKKVRYEVIATDAQPIQAATGDSPAITGEVIISLDAGWTVSFIEA